MNHVIMGKWIDQVYTQHITAKGQKPHCSILFMDNMGSHDTDEIEEVLTEKKLKTMLLPPNCTPLLQPLDHAITPPSSASTERLWAEWYKEVGCKRLTAKGNKKKATEEDVNGWVAGALHCITPELVRKCWRHTLMLPPCLVRLPAQIWEGITSFLTERERVQTAVPASAQCSSLEE
jgi:hypothetical protein